MMTILMNPLIIKIHLLASNLALINTQEIYIIPKEEK
jgi:hypothetical protein